MKPSARGVVGMVFDSDRQVTLLFGGQDSNGDELDDTWAWDGSNWAQQAPAMSPTARGGHAMAYDSSRGVTVLFGGAANNVLNDETWEWDGTNWTQRMPPLSPPARNFHAMAYDSARGVTVLFGGADGNGPLGDTWEWDGSNWSLKSPSAAPSARIWHAMVCDSDQGETVLFGGVVDSAPVTFSNETWVWNGTNWAQKLAATAPSPAGLSAMAFDSGRGKSILFGGLVDFNPSMASAESWEWDGTKWTLTHPAGPPSAGFAHGTAYDSSRHVTVLFGGSDGTAPNDETWELSIPTILIDQEPSSQSIAAGQSASFSAIASAGAVLLDFAWRLNGTPLSDGGAISGSATETLTINPATAADAGSYDCVISNACQTVVSDAATLIVTSDADGDGVADSNDQCPDADDTLDADGNGTPDCLDAAADQTGGCCAPEVFPTVGLFTPLTLMAWRRRRRRAKRNTWRGHHNATKNLLVRESVLARDTAGIVSGSKTCTGMDSPKRGCEKGFSHQQMLNSKSS